jgi:methylmalonyl-CoA/ethylmalonyl-CoA epimerase
MIQLNHIGIAVDDLPHMKKLFSILGLGISDVEEVGEQGVKAHFIPLEGQACRLELLEPTDPTGTVAQFIQKRGPGIHHLSFTVTQGQLEATCEKLVAGGFRLIYPSPRSGAHGMRINFIHPSSCGGILVEVMEQS